MLGVSLARFFCSSVRYTPALICKTVKQCIQDRDFTTIPVLEPHILNNLSAFQGDQLGYLFVSLSEENWNSPKLLASIGTLLLTQVNTLHNTILLKTFMGMLDIFRSDQLNWPKFVQCVTDSDFDVTSAATLLHKCSKVTPSPTELVPILREKIMNGPRDGYRAETIAIALHSMNKLGWNNIDDYKMLIGMYTQIDKLPKGNEYVMVLTGAGELAMENRKFVTKMRKYLGQQLETTDVQMLCNICHTASLNPGVFTAENWEQLNSACFKYKDAIVTNALDLSTILHAFNRARINLAPWIQAIPVDSVKTWTSLQLSVIAFSTRFHLPFNHGLREAIKEATLAMLPAMSAKHKLNTLLMWSEQDLFDEAMWTKLDPYLDSIAGDLRDTRWNQHAFNQLRTIGVRISKFRKLQFTPPRR